MKYSIIDIEANGLLKEATKIHCLSYRDYDGTTLIKAGTFTDYNDITTYLDTVEAFVGHSIITYDIPLVKKILNYTVTSRVIDTLCISFYHYPVKAFKHGLKFWGERLGFGKPEVEDWETQPIEVYINRCEGDVEINTRLFHGQMEYLLEIYEQDLDQVLSLIAYLGFKRECIRDQEIIGIDLDVELAEKSMKELTVIIDKKVQSLSDSMPKELGKLLHSMPKNMYKKDQTLSAHAVKWMERVKDHGLSQDVTEIRESPNPGSPVQLKKWLFSIGWDPITFKLNDKQEEVPQVSLPFGAGLCPSIKVLFDDNPGLEELDGLYKAQHRFGVFKSFIENKDENDKVYSTAHGFTNTLRMQHSKPIANLPGVDKWYGEQIRSCLTTREFNKIMCGSDISGLEDNTKQHYIHMFDPKYVEDMRVPGFDPHIDIGVLSGLLTPAEEKYYKEIENLKEEQKSDFKFFEESDEIKYKRIKKIRGNAKVVNFSATYGAGPPKIAKTLKCTLEFAKTLHKTYWTRNKAVKQTAEACTVKIVKGQKWLYNPISGFWLYLKAEKDRFSTLNQNRHNCSV